MIGILKSISNSHLSAVIAPGAAEVAGSLLSKDEAPGGICSSEFTQ